MSSEEMKLRPERNIFIEKKKEGKDDKIIGNWFVEKHLMLRQSGGFGFLRDLSRGFRKNAPPIKRKHRPGAQRG